jgi:aminopeptidase-like protein
LTACEPPVPEETVSIDEQMLLRNLKIISHDSLEGRFFGTSGNIAARDFIANSFDSLGIPAAFNTGYIQEFPYTFSGKRRQRMYPVPNPEEDFSNVPDTTVIGGNVVAKIEGQTNDIIVITAHLDHLGIRDGETYNGADDNASGSAALITIANYFNTRNPRHTLVFAAVDAEEIGSLGCAYFLEEFPGALENVVLNVNMDMIAHNDTNQLYATGLYHYPELKQPLEEISSDILLLYGHDDPADSTLDDWTFASDHREFHKRNIPFIYFGVEDHPDYHQPSDTFENINTSFYAEAVKLVIQAIEGYDIYLVPGTENTNTNSIN